MRTFRHTIAAIFALLPAGSCFAQIAGLRQIGATSTQIIVAWNYSPASGDCTVAGARDNGQGLSGSSPFAPLAFDMDPSKFANANDQQSRYPTLQIGAYRVFVIGTSTIPSDPYPSLASDGANYSRALQQDSLYNVQVTCGASNAVIQAHTAQLPPGITYHFPFAIGGAGNYASPTPSFTMDSTLIDPSTGILLTQLTQPGVQEQSKKQAFASAGACANWTNASNMFAADGNYATYSAGSHDKCAVLFGGTGLTSFDYALGPFQFDGYQLSVVGHGSTAEQVDVCFTFDGATCIPGGQTVQVTLPSLTDSAQTVPSAITPIDTTWMPWQYYEGATSSTGVTGNANFGVLIWKASNDSSTISIDQVEMTLSYSKTFLSWNGGENIPCSSQFVQDSNGLNGNLCMLQAASGSYYVFWISDQTSPPAVRFVGDNLSGALNFTGDASFNADSVTVQGLPPFSDVTPTDFFAVATDTNGKLHLLECVAPASGNNWWTNLYPAGSNTSLSGTAVSHACPQPSGTNGDWTDLTPASGSVLYDPNNTSDSLIDQFAESYPGGCTLMPTTSYPCFTGTLANPAQVAFPSSNWSIQDAQSHYVILQVRRVQNDVAWIVAVDVSTTPATIVGAYQTWMNAADRWDVLHTPHQTGNTTWTMEAGSPDIAPGTPNDGGGPYAVTLEANMTASQNTACVDTNIPSETEAGQSGALLFNVLTMIEPGDIVINHTTGEFMWVTVVTTPGSCSTGQYQLTVDRGVNGGTGRAASSGQLLYMVTGISPYASAAKVYWNFADPAAKYGDISGSDRSSFFVSGFMPPVTCTPIATCYANDYFGDHESYFNGYDIGEAGYACSQLGHPGQSCTQFLLARPSPFSGNTGAPGNPDFGQSVTSHYEPHPASPQGALALANATLPAIDEDILNESAPFACSAPVLVAGSLYSCTPAYTPNYKGAYVMVFDGVSPLTDVSGHASLIGSGSPANYQFCFAYSAGECQSGSLAGTLYVNDPTISPSSTCNFSGTGGAVDFSFYEQGQLCVGQLPQNQDGVQEEAMSGQSTRLGALFRTLTDAMTPFGRYNGFATAHTFGANRDVIFDCSDCGSMSGVRDPREDLWLAQVPSWKPVSTPQYDFIWMPVTIPAPPTSLGVSSAEIDFGYDQNFYCTSRQEACVAYQTAQNDASPFAFGSIPNNTDSYARAACSSGCTILIPVIPDRVAYYTIKLYNSAGVLVSQSAVRPLAPL